MAKRRTENGSLRALIASGDWTYESLARAVNALGAENGTRLRYDRTSVAHWLAGAVPRPQVRELIAEAFTRRMRRPVTPADLGMEPPAHDQREPLRTPDGPPDAVTRLAALCAADADPARRTVLEQCVYRAPDPDTSRWQRLLDSHRPRTGVRGGEPECGREAEQVRAAVEFFGRAGELGGRHARSALVSYLNDDVAPRLYAGGFAESHRPLLTETARLVLVLAGMYGDDLKNGAAQRYHRAGLHLAAEAGDRSAYATALCEMATHALDVGHPGPALRIIEAASRASPTGTPARTRAFLLSRLALARASAGHRDGVADCLAEAERHWSRAPAPGPETDRIPGGYTRACHAFDRGRTLAALGDRAGAVAALRLSVEQRSPTSYRMRALTHAELARLLLGSGRLDEACAAWHRFLDDYPHLRSGRADRALAGLCRDVGVHTRHPRVRALLERARTAGAGPG